MLVDRLTVSAYTIPTEEPEADGTFAWNDTTVVVVEASAGDTTGLGFTYGPTACATLIDAALGDVVIGSDAMDVPGAWRRMVRRIRNVGRPGVASLAIAAVDTALWDLKAKILELPLCRLLGQVTASVRVYASGGFTSYDEGRLTEQLGGWVHEQGIPRVKMKIGVDRGAREDLDVRRVAAARAAIGPDAELFVDANGAYERKQAVRVAHALTGQAVTWFEEPVSSDDLEGLREVRDMTEIEVAAGEYGYDLAYFSRMVSAGAVDVVQIDVSRCGGITEWFRVAAVAAAHGLEVSGHTAHALHLHPACATQNVRHLEYFHDHARIDAILFDGAPEPVAGELRPDLDRIGTGLTLKRADANRYRRAA